MNTGGFNGKFAGYDMENPMAEQLKAVTDRISQLIAETRTSDNPKNLQDLAVLQTTLFTLQQQQLLQMQILAHMQNQMKTNTPDSPQQRSDSETKEDIPQTPPSSGSDPLRKLQEFIGSDSKTSEPVGFPGSGMPPGYGSVHHNQQQQQQPGGGGLPPPSSEHLTPEQDANSPLNSLELLQQKAQGILNNASHGLLKHSLADLSYSKNLSKDDPHSKHRCKFCGKVFGSDSALQIHIR